LVHFTWEKGSLLLKLEGIALEMHLRGIAEIALMLGEKKST